MGLEMNRAALERQMQDGLTSLYTELTQRCAQHDAQVSSLGSVSSHEGDWTQTSLRQAWSSIHPVIESPRCPGVDITRRFFRWRGWRRRWRRGAIG